MFKTQVKPRAAGKWFHRRGLNILWRFVFYNNICFYLKPKTKQPALRDMLRHFNGRYSHKP